MAARGRRLEQFPGVIECISSVLDPSADEESIQQEDNLFGWKSWEYGDSQLKDYEKVKLLDEYELKYLTKERKSLDSPCFSLRRLINTCNGFDGLVEQAMNVIRQLAVDGENRRILSNTVLHKFAVTAPLKLHSYNDDACSTCQIKYWVPWLVAAIKETNNQGQILEQGQPTGEGRSRGEEIQEEVEECLLRSAHENAIISIRHAIESIFDCLDCRAVQKRQCIQILLHLSLDMSFIMVSESRARRLTWILLANFFSAYDGSEYWMISNFADRNDFYRIRRLAGEKLLDMLREKYGIPLEGDAKSQLICLALRDLTRAFADDAEDISIRTHATIIIEGLCVAHKFQREFIMEVREILGDMIPKYMTMITAQPVQLRKAPMHAVNGAGRSGRAPPA
ncbi:hypothetical protein C2845_PM05G01210 [Panicum miliaceum]|uniref:Uncharacterized protein n=1 Tax=Panicum miliaceum TaxID=4540 RepID=A0A3L6SZP1_PANMI|nr:hypothetical protein C2845_PM05G01210 [Panicum miliaceum]